MQSANAKTFLLNSNGSQNFALTYLEPQDGEDYRIRFEATFNSFLTASKQSTVICMIKPSSGYTPSDQEQLPAFAFRFYWNTGTCSDTGTLAVEFFGDGSVKNNAGTYQWRASGGSYTYQDMSLYGGNIGSVDLASGTTPNTRYILTSSQLTTSNLPTVGGSTTNLVWYAIYNSDTNSHNLLTQIALTSYSESDSAVTVLVSEYTSESSRSIKVGISCLLVVICLTLFSIF